MADRKTAAVEGQSDEEKARLEAEEAQRQASEQAQRDGAQATEEARQQSLETLRQQEQAKPEPSQEEADQIKVAAATGGMAYTTRDAKAQ